MPVQPSLCGATHRGEGRPGPLESLWSSLDFSTATAPLRLPFADRVCRGVAIGPHHSFGNPGLVHTPLHALHYQVQERLDRLAHVGPIGSARFKVGDSGRQERHLRK